jgi:hypothetical protein
VAHTHINLRLRLLQADAVVVENGGRIFYNDVEQLTPLTEDQGWRHTHATVIGSAFEVRHVRESRAPGGSPARTPHPPLTGHFGMRTNADVPAGRGAEGRALGPVPGHEGQPVGGGCAQLHHRVPSAPHT